MAVVFHFHAAGRVARHLRQQLGGKIDHAVVIRVSLVKLQHGEFGVVLRGQPLVAEIAIDLVDPLQAAHQQPLQI